MRFEQIINKYIDQTCLENRKFSSGFSQSSVHDSEVLHDYSLLRIINLFEVIKSRYIFLDCKNFF